MGVESFMKVLGMGGLATASYGLVNDLSIPLFGVPLTVIGMAAAGAYLSFAYGKPEKDRKKLYLLALANTFLACVCVAVLPSALGWECANHRIEAPLSGLFAFGARWWVPAFIESIPQWIQRILKIGDYKDIQKEEKNEDITTESKE
jgi:hypothetical protein